MKTPLRIGINLPDSVYRPEFVRRAVEFLRAAIARLRSPNYHEDRTYLGELVRHLIHTPRYRYDVRDTSWRALVSLISVPGQPLVSFSMHIELPDDIHAQAFERRIEALFDELEIQLEKDTPDTNRLHYLAHAIVDTPREFSDTVRSEAGHVPAFGVLT